MLGEEVMEYTRPYAGKSVLISGAGGYIGSAIVAALSRAECRLVLFCRAHNELTLPERGSARLRVVEADLSHPEAWGDEPAKADVIFHLAALEHKHGSASEPLLDLAVNAGSVLSLLETCRRLGVAPGIILASSSNLVGVPEQLPVDERVPDNPLNLYAIHKLAAERYLDYYRRAFGIPSAALRLVNVYGPVPAPGVSERVVVNRIIRKALEGEALTLFKNHACTRDFLFVDDAVRAFLAAGARVGEDTERYYVIGTGEGVTIGEMVHRIALRASLRIGHDVPVLLDEEVRIEAVEWRNLVADSSRFRRATGWRPSVSLTEGVDRTIEEFL